MSYLSDKSNQTTDAKGRGHAVQAELRNRRDFVRLSVVAAGSALLASQTLALGVAGASPMPTLTAPSTTTYANPAPLTIPADTMTITGVAPTQTLSGAVNVQYILADGTLQSVPASVTYLGTVYNSPFSLNETGSNVTLTINYPPTNQWPEQPLTGTQGIFVNVSIEVTEGGILIGTLGPGQAWGVSVINNPTLVLPNPRIFHYPNFPTTTLHPLLWTAGVQAGQQITGTVWCQYVLDNGVVQQIPGSVAYNQKILNSPGFVTFQKGEQMTVQLNIPPAAQWPAQANGTKQVQSVMSMNVISNGKQIATLGSGLSYTVTCLGGPAPASKRG